MRQVTRADTTKVSKSGLGAQIYVLKLVLCSHIIIAIRLILQG